MGDEFSAWSYKIQDFHAASSSRTVPRAGMRHPWSISISVCSTPHSRSPVCFGNAPVFPS